MNPTLLVLLSVSVTLLMIASLKGAFCLIEKAHEHLRESESRKRGAELVKGTGG